MEPTGAIGKAFGCAREGLNTKLQIVDDVGNLPRKVVYMDRLLEHVNKLGYPLMAVSGTEFATALRNTATEVGREHIFITM